MRSTAQAQTALMQSNKAGETPTLPAKKAPKGKPNAEGSNLTDRAGAAALQAKLNLAVEKRSRAVDKASGIGGGTMTVAINGGEHLSGFSTTKSPSAPKRPFKR